MKIKPVKINYLVTVEVVPTEDGMFDTQKAFDDEDAKAMAPYLKQKIESELRDSFNYGAVVSKFKVVIV